MICDCSDEADIFFLFKFSPDMADIYKMKKILTIRETEVKIKSTFYKTCQSSIQVLDGTQFQLYLGMGNVK